jgi:predicted  nucleic acid-binding Zn-ribbon protein
VPGLHVHRRNMRRSKSINTLLKSSETPLQEYVIELELKLSEMNKNSIKLHKKNAKLESQNIDQKHRISAVEKELKEKEKPIKHIFNMVEYRPESEQT